MVKSQSAYYSKLSEPNIRGGLVVQLGYCKFPAKNKTVTLQTDLRTVLGFSYAMKKGQIKEGTSSGLLFTCTGTVVTSGKFVRVSRKTGDGANYWTAGSAATFWYELVGY